MDVKGGKCGEPRQEEKVARGESHPTRRRKPYHKPAFRCERVFETTALSCGKVTSTQQQFTFNRKTS